MNKIMFTVFVFICCLGLNAQQNIKEVVKALVADIDAQKIGGTLQNQEFVVALYQQILDRNPSEQEVIVATSILSGNDSHRSCTCHEIKVKRSQLLASLLVKKENNQMLTWEILEKNLSLLENLNLTTVPFWTPYMPMIEAESNAEIDATFEWGVEGHRDEYQLYHGYFHAHTGYSDGTGTPEEAYKMARDDAKLDFFAVTDHAILLGLWPDESYWQKIKDVANEFQQDGAFVALHGFEWSSPLFGHINVIHSDDFTDCVRSLEVKEIYKWISERAQTIARFNHPGTLDDFSVEFDHFKLYPAVVWQMAGIEMHNGGDGVRFFFHQKGYSGKFNHMDEANQKGWKLGAIGGQDNHGGKWGFRTNYVVGVWAKDLTREGILDAYRGRRTFATEDRDLSLSFTMNEAQMGSRLREGEKEIVISLADNENFSKVTLYRSGEPVETFALKGQNPTIHYSIQTRGDEYYYVLAEQQDGDLALSSPIWILDSSAK